MVLTAILFNPFYGVLFVVGLGLTIYTIVDLLRHPDWTWQASGQNKVLWMVLVIVGFFLCFAGLLFDLIYLLAIRPKVVAAEGRGGPGGGGYQGQYGGGGYGTPPPYGGTTPYGGAPQYGGSGYGAPSGPPNYGVPNAPPSYGSPGGSIGSDYPGYGNPAPTPAPAPSSPASPPAGWYPDPAGSGQPRYWDGNAWAPGASS